MFLSANKILQSALQLLIVIGKKGTQKKLIRKELKKIKKKEELKTVARATASQKKEAVRKQKEDKEEDKKEKARKKAEKVAMRLRNDKIERSIRENIGKEEKGTPAIYNKIVNLSRIFSQMNRESLYFPCQTPDDRLAMDLAQIIQGVSGSYSTKLPTIDDYDKHITDLTDLHNLSTTLCRQLKNSIEELKNQRNDLVTQQTRRAITRSNSFSVLEEQQSKKRKHNFTTSTLLPPQKRKLPSKEIPQPPKKRMKK